MSLWRQLSRGLRVLTNRTAADREVDDEVRQYLDESTAAHMQRGLSPEQARRQARMELGNESFAREQVRSYGWENIVGTLTADLRYGARQLRRNPGFALVAILTLALGIGASSAIFSAVNPILFEPLPYPYASRILRVSDFGRDGAPVPVTFGTYREVVERSHSFEAIAAFKPWQATLTGTGQPERFDGQRVSADYFRALGVRPAIGRDFQPSDDVANGPRVAIISHGMWRRYFAGDHAIIGRQIRLDDDSFIVIGVMPQGFDNVLAPQAEIWAPLQYDIRQLTNPNTREWGHHLKLVARLLPGVAAEQARTELNAIAHHPIPQFVRVPWASLDGGLIVTALQEDITRGVRPALLAIVGAVLLVLLIACVNVTNLLLARAAQRRGEFAMRAALGAGRGRMVRQLVTESLLLAFTGGALGMVVAEFGVRALVALSPPELPRLHAIRVDGAVLAFGIGITTLIGLVFGLIPAVQSARADILADLQQSSRRAAGGHHWTRRALVVAEVALALVLLVSAGLLWRSMKRLFEVDPGFNASHLLTMQVHATGHRYDNDAATRQLFQQMLDRVREVPGVRSAAFTAQLPLSGDQDIYGVRSEAEDQRNASPAFRYSVTPGYFETAGIPLLRGRPLDERDTENAPRVALISESFARKRFAGQDPTGKRLQIGGGPGPMFTIVGVVGDVKQTSLAADESDAVYVPAKQWLFAEHLFSLVVRAGGEAAALVPAIESAIWSVDKDQAILRVATMDELLQVLTAERRFALILFEAFALAALLLAAIGIYGVLSGSVSERTREIGVRAALGATRGDILALVLRQGMALTALGVVLGLSGAIMATSTLVTMLFGVSRLDPATYAGVIALLLGVSAMACWLPAWRASRVDPSITLRAE